MITADPIPVQAIQPGFEVKQITFNKDMYWWFERQLEGCNIKITAKYQVDDDENLINVWLVKLAIVNQGVLAYMRSQRISVAETEQVIYDQLVEADSDELWELVAERLHSQIVNG